jgi:hypothetical protein
MKVASTINDVVNAALSTGELAAPSINELSAVALEQVLGGQQTQQNQQVDQATFDSGVVNVLQGIGVGLAAAGFVVTVPVSLPTMLIGTAGMTVGAGLAGYGAGQIERAIPDTPYGPTPSVPGPNGEAGGGGASGGPGEFHGGVGGEGGGYGGSGSDYGGGGAGGAGGVTEVHNQAGGEY